LKPKRQRGSGRKRSRDQPAPRPGKTGPQRFSGDVAGIPPALPRPKAAAENADTSTQLNYAFITQPNPGYLTAGQTAELEFTVSNPGDPVTLSSIAFTFPYGSAGSDLCASVSDVSVKTLPGPCWTAGTDKSGNFVLTPPGGSISVDTNGLTFTLSIQVNAEVGVVNLNSGGPVQSFTIEEFTDTGRDYWSPPDPLSKFPPDFQFSNLVANPPIVQQGGPIELSWTGTPGASYTIDWPGGEAITYSGGPAPITQSDISFPPPGSGETLAAGASQSAFFSVTAEYSSGGQTLHTGPLTVSVGVNPNAPTITSFTAIWQGPVLELNWATENAASVEIPSITTEALIPNPETPLLFTPSSTQPLPSSITLTAINQSFQTASTLVQGPFPQAAGSPILVNYPSSVAVSPDGAHVFVANQADGTLTVLDAGTLQPITGSPVSVGHQPISVAVSPDGARVFVANQADNTLTVLETQTLRPISGSPVSVGQQPISVAVSPDGKRAFVANYDDNTLTVLDGGTLQPITGSPVSVGNYPRSVAVSPDGARVFVANETDNTLTVLDGGMLQPITGSPVSVGNQPKCVAVSPDGKRVYVASFLDNTLTVLEAGTLRPIPESPVTVGNFPLFVAVSPDGRRVFVANDISTLTILDAQTLRQMSGSPVSVGRAPLSVAVSPDGARVFVANSADNTLTVLTPAFVPADTSPSMDAAPAAVSRASRSRRNGKKPPLKRRKCRPN
jgi:YVTN family beta-propeller protein